jgi:hypothetical protein
MQARAASRCGPERFDPLQAACGLVQLAKFRYGVDPKTAEFAEQMLSKFVNWVIDTDDDTIDTTIRVFEKDDFHYASLKPLEVLKVKRQMFRPTGYPFGTLETYYVEDNTEIRQNITMEHKGQVPTTLAATKCRRCRKSVPSSPPGPIGLAANCF